MKHMILTIGLLSALCCANSDSPTSPQQGDSLPDFSQATAEYLAAFATAGDARWAADAGVAVHGRTYYDRPYAWYALGESERGDSDDAAYVNGFVAPNNGWIAPRNMQPDGMAEHYLRTDDPVVLSSISAISLHITQNFVAKGYTGPRAGWPDNWEGRIQERAMLATMANDALAVPGYQPVIVKDDILATQNPDGSWTPPSSNMTSLNTGLQVSSNFQAALAMSALTRYAEYYDDDVANILASVEAGMEWMWTTQWVASGGGFKYFSDDAATGGPTASPDLNMLFVDVFGWLYYKTGDSKWITRGDEIFLAALTRRTYNVDVKQFNQFFRNSWRYLYYRDGFDISILQNPTEVHR